jgi:phosphoribosyl-dephospho-CoA transferase
MDVFRHDLVFVSAKAWRAHVAACAELASEPIAIEWVDRGWPLVARRFAPHEREGLALGLPLPPSAGKRRLSVLMRPDDVVSVTPPQKLMASIDVAPRPWRCTLERIVDAAAAYGVEARVFGSLAWCALTGLDYVTPASDLDVLLPIPRNDDVGRLLGELAAIEAVAPMRVDGEVLRDDGAGANWREVHAGAREVLVKDARGVGLLDTFDFLDGRPLPS